MAEAGLRAAGDTSRRNARSKAWLMLPRIENMVDFASVKCPDVRPEEEPAQRNQASCPFSRDAPPLTQNPNSYPGLTDLEQANQPHDDRTNCCNARILWHPQRKWWRQNNPLCAPSAID